MTTAPARTIVIGAGPAGLTAARELVGQGQVPLVLEADQTVGGLSRTVERDGWRFDIGGHRFFSRSADVREIWADLLGPEDFLERPRLSRIHYEGQFFDYPLNPRNLFHQIGPVESLRCLGSFAWARIAPPDSQDTFDGWVSARFGRRLYEKFFRSYTEKVWGVPAAEIDADWAAQRIKGMSLADAARLTRRGRTGSSVTSLIDRFHYPRLGPGMMWDACRRQVEAGGGTVVTGAPVGAIVRDQRGATGVRCGAPERQREYACTSVISSMPLGQLVESMSPAPPPSILAAARGLRHRDFLTVALIVPQQHAFPDNWIYIHSDDVRVGRVQNYGAWSPDMRRRGESTTCLGLEYFVNAGDELWSLTDDELVTLASTELSRLGIAPRVAVSAGYVVRMPLAYPVYDRGYRERVEVIRRWLEKDVPNVLPIGRNGMHRYNNQDHSMLTAIAAVRRLGGGSSDPWTVNAEAAYLEEQVSDDGRRLFAAA